MKEYKEWIQTHYLDNESVYICSVCREVTIGKFGQIQDGHFVCTMCNRDRKIDTLVSTIEIDLI